MNEPNDTTSRRKTRNFAKVLPTQPGDADSVTHTRDKSRRFDVCSLLGVCITHEVHHY